MEADIRRSDGTDADVVAPAADPIQRSDSRVVGQAK
jgi:hypothetical protein